MKSLAKFFLSVISVSLLGAFWCASVSFAGNDNKSIGNTANTASAATIAGKKNNRIEIPINQSYVLKLKQPATEVSVVNPEIAKVSIINPDEILINAVAAGRTSLVVFYDGSKNQMTEIEVKWNIDELNEVFKQTLPDEAIKVISLKNGIALSGSVSSAEAVTQALELASSVCPKVVNMLTVPGRQQVLLKVKVAEVARNFREEMGANFLVTNESGFGGNLLGNMISGDYGTASNTDVDLSDAVTLFFGLPKGDVYGFVQAMKSKGLIHILAEPNLLARSGESATFLAGGEYPIPVVQGGMTNSVTIEYKEYGVRLEFTPTIVDGEAIHLDIAPEVSDLDFVNGVTMSGFVIPALVSRKAHTVIQMEAGQTFAIAGMINKSRNDTKKKVPLLGDVPMLGNLFKNNQKNIKETELLIMVTPYIVKPLKSDQQKLVPEDIPSVDDLYELPDNSKTPSAGVEPTAAPAPRLTSPTGAKTQNSKTKPAASAPLQPQKVNTDRVVSASEAVSAPSAQKQQPPKSKSDRIADATSAVDKPSIDEYSKPYSSSRIGGSNSGKSWMTKGKEP